MRDLLECTHSKRSFVQSRRGSGERHSVYVCEDCGEIMIHIFKDGVSYELNFHIDDPAQLDMMRQWTDYVWEDTGGKP
jgi:hypothetical protein